MDSLQQVTDNSPYPFRAGDMMPLRSSFRFMTLTPCVALGGLLAAAACSESDTSANMAQPIATATNTGGTAGNPSDTDQMGADSTGGSGDGGATNAEGGMGGQAMATGGGGSGGVAAGGNNAAAGAGGEGGAGGAAEPKSELSFFLTSSNPDEMGGNLGGLDGADAHCQMLAEAVDAGDRDWKAYLSTDAEDARDRIGEGPWTNANGVVVATSVDDLHSDNNMLNKENSVTEAGEVVNGAGDDPNRHDILTGSNLDGTAADATCNNWTDNSADFNGRVGHHDRQGGGQNPSSWNSAHDSNGCSIENLRGTGGDGRFYCFAADPPPQ